MPGGRVVAISYHALSRALFLGSSEIAFMLIDQ
jgi:hypothetical protein